MSNRFGGAAAFRSALLVTGATYVSYIVGLLVSMIVARELGPRQFGHYAYLIWLAGTLTMLFCNGITLSAIRFIADTVGRGQLEDAKRVQHLLRSWFVTSLIGFSIAFLLTHRWLQPADWSKPAWIFASAALVAAAAKSCYLFYSSSAKGHGRFEVDAYTIFWMSAVNLVGALALALMNAPLEGYIAFFVLQCLGHAVLAWLLFRRAGMSSLPGALPEALQERIRKNFFWTAMLLVILAFSNKSIETLFLNAWVGPEAVGWFAIAAAIARGGVDLLSAGLNSVLLPAMSHAIGSNDVSRANRILVDAIRVNVFLGFTLAGVGLLFAGPAITLLYGAQYAPAIVGLQVMMVAGALTMPIDAISSMLMSTDRQSVRVVMATGAFVVTIVAALLLVPRFGFLGALAAHAITRCVYLAACMAVAIKTFKVAMPFAEFLRCAAAAGVGTALALPILLSSTSLPAQALAGVAYGFGCIVGSLLLRVWNSDDVRALTGALERFRFLQPILKVLATFSRRV